MNHLPMFEDRNIIIGYQKGKPVIKSITTEEQKLYYFEFGLTPNDLEEMILKFGI